MVQYVAIFPGSFKPPHQGHVSGLISLVARDDIDKILIVISGRIRQLPNSILALDAISAERVWKILLKSIPLRGKEVSIMIAAKTAVEAIGDYVTNCPERTRLLLCLGEADFCQVDQRFHALIQKFPDKYLRVVVLPTAACRVHATDLRTALAQGDSGKEAFCAGLSVILADSVKDAIWNSCLQSTQSVHDIKRIRLKNILRPLPLNHWS